MIVLTILAIIDWVALFLYNPSNFFTWLCLFTTMTFVLRRFGINVKAGRLLAGEMLVLFICFNGSMLMRTFSVSTYLVMVLIRFVFYGLVYYDDKCYVYITEEEEKEL